VIIPFILMTCIFDHVVILYGEIRCLSLLVKGLEPERLPGVARGIG